MNIPNSPQHTVLIADDDADARTIVNSAVSVMGYTAVEASSGSDALDMFQRLSPDLVILDVTMPGLTGTEVCRNIKKSEFGAHVPVIMLTARDTVKDKVVALEEGADDYLTKPFHYQELQARIRALLRVRELNVSLLEKNEELRKMQDKLVAQERQILATQMAGTAAHRLGQPLSAVTLNLFLLETVPQNDPRYKRAFEAVKQDLKRMTEMLDELKRVDPGHTVHYYGGASILEVKDK
jgi:DNA-binding response OmpR family regulator